jgi:hypothetical protein
MANLRAINHQADLKNLPPVLSKQIKKSLGNEEKLSIDN